MKLARIRFRSVAARLALAAVLASTALALAQPSAAEAQVADPDFWKQTAEHRDTVYRFVYRQSPQSTPPSYDPVLEAEQILRQRQAALAPSTPQAPSLWQQVRGVTFKSGLSVAPRALGWIGLTTGVFEVGWKIGSGINAKFLTLGVPERKVEPNSAKWDLIRWRTANSGEHFGARWPAQAGWVPEFSYAFDHYDRWFTEPCTFRGFTPPEPFDVYGPVASNATCAYGYPSQTAPVNVLYGWAPENALGAPGPIEDYTGQSYTESSPAPTPPPQATVEQSIDNEIAKPENGLLRQWLNYVLGSPGEQDPLGIGAPNPEIEFPGFVEHWEEHGDEFTPAYADPVEYWRDAADIVERGEAADPDVLKCDRPSDGARIYWDSVRRAIVIVKDGKIVTYFKPPGPPPADFDYWYEQCSG